MAVVDERLDAQLAVGDPQVAMEHGSGLAVVEVVEGHASNHVDLAGPQVPQQPQHEGHRQHRSGHHPDGEPPAAGLLRRARREGTPVFDALLVDLLWTGDGGGGHHGPPRRRWKYRSPKARTLPVDWSELVSGVLDASRYAAFHSWRSPSVVVWWRPPPSGDGFGMRFSTPMRSLTKLTNLGELDSAGTCWSVVESPSRGVRRWHEEVVDHDVRIEIGCSVAPGGSRDPAQGGPDDGAPDCRSRARHRDPRSDVARSGCRRSSPHRSDDSPSLGQNSLGHRFFPRTWSRSVRTLGPNLPCVRLAGPQPWDRPQLGPRFGVCDLRE